MDAANSLPPEQPTPPSALPPAFSPPVITPPPRSQPPPSRKSRGWMVVALVLFVLLGFSVLANLSHTLGSLMPGTAQSARSGGPRLEEMVVRSEGSADKIAVIDVEGIISGQHLDGSHVTLPELLKEQFRRAEKDARVKAVILRVNSPGGEVLASDDINRIIAKFQSKTGKPVVASMGGLAASGGYYISAPCRYIVANELTITGSIGVIISTLNYRTLMDKVGLSPVVFKSGRFKNMLAGNRKLEDIPVEEREMIDGLIEETFNKFKLVVSEGRGRANGLNQGDGQTLATNWHNFADGRILTGKQALDIGLVDELGDFDQAVAATKRLAKLGDANLIQYQQIFDLADLFGMFGKTESRAIKVDLGMDFPKLQSGQPYFLAPTFVH